ncbi:MAG: D-Ala-D-Ala carboxypeptidase [Ilumatobacteraceae bacterium]|nr:D-Ala-D-Ala carboxypeptidase [Ilumatobacteraceae bacterium]
MAGALVLLAACSSGSATSSTEPATTGSGTIVGGISVSTPRPADSTETPSTGGTRPSTNGATPRDSRPGETTGAAGATTDSGTATAASSPADTPPGSPPAATLDAAALQQWLDEWRAASGLTSVVVGVQVGDRDPIVASSGRTTADAPDPTAPFYIASITKTFVTAIVLQLVEAHEVDLDEPVANHVQLWPAADTITVRQLLGHRSGLPGVAGLDTQDEWAARILDRPAHLWTPREVLSYIDDQPLLFEPGTQYHYSNTDFIVAGLLVEAVTHAPIAEALQSRLTGPLGLDATYLDAGTGPIGPTIPPAYYDVPGKGDGIQVLRAARPSIVSVYGSSAAMVSTPADVVRWFRDVYGTDAVLSGASRLAMFDPDHPGDGLGTKALCPCSGTGRPGGRGHDGIFPGFDSLGGWFAGADVAVVVYTNHSPTPTSLLQGAIDGVLALVRTG